MQRTSAKRFQRQLIVEIEGPRRVTTRERSLKISMNRQDSLNSLLGLVDSLEDGR